MTPDNAIWWLKLKAKQKQNKVAPIFQGGTLPVTDITAKAPEWVKYRKEYVKNNPFNIYEYVENRFNNPVGREAISRINEKAWKETLKQEGLKKRQSELDEATKMGLLYQRFNPQEKDDISIADEQFQKRYGTSPHRYRYDNDPEYKKYYEQQARNATSKIDYPSTDLRRKDVVAPNNMWMYPNLTGESKKTMTDFSNEVIGMALPIPGLETMGKIPSIFKAGKKLIKPVSKVVGKTDDATKAGSKVLNKADDVVKPIASKVDDAGMNIGKTNKSILEFKPKRLNSIQNINNQTLGDININQSSINPNVVIERQIKLSDDPPFLDDLATRTRHGKTKIGHNIVDNIPKEDKLIMTQQSGDLIHRTKLGEFNNGWHINEEGRLFKLNSGSEKKSFHFSGAGKQVKSHSVGTWDDDATTIITPFNSFGNYNGFPRSTAINDVYWWNPRQLEFPQSTKIFTGDMELASHLKKSNLKDVVFSPDVYKIQQKMKKVERFSDEWTKLAKENKKLHDDFISQSNAQPISGLDENIDLGIRETIQKRNNTFDAELFDKRNLRSFNESPYVHDEDRLLKEQWSSGDKKHKLKFDTSEKKAAEYYNEMTKTNIDNKNWENLNDWKDVMAKEDGRLSHTDKIIIQQQALNTKNKGVLKGIANEINNKLYLTERDRFIVTAIREKLKTGKPIYTYGIGGALLLNGTTISELSKVKNK